MRTQGFGSWMCAVLLALSSVTPPVSGAELQVMQDLNVGRNVTGPAGGIGRYQNLLKYSEAFDNATSGTTWSETGVTIVADSATAAPNGATTADQLTFPNAGSVDSTQQDSGVVSTTAAYTFSVWLRSVSGGTTIVLKIQDTDENNTTVVTGLSNTTWERYSVSKTFGTAGGNIIVTLLENAAADNPVLLAWGAQLEQNPSPGVYVRTAASAVSTAGYGAITDGVATGTGVITGLTADAGGATTGAAVTIAGGTNGIDTVRSADIVTLNLDTTEIGASTFGTNADFAWTFNSSGATDPILTFGSSAISLNDGILLDLSAINMSANTEGLKLPQVAGACTNATAEGEICWDTASDNLYVGTGSVPKQINTSATAWDAIGDPAGNGAVAMANTAQTLDWTSPSTATAVDWLTVTATNGSATDATTQRLLVLKNKDDAGASGTLERLLVLDNADANEAVTTALEIVGSSTGAITTAIDVSDPEIGTALAIGGNDITSASGAQVQFASATSLSIPAGTGPTVDAAGETAVDTTDDQLIYFGGAKRVLAYKQQVCVALQNAGPSDVNKRFWVAPMPVTITDVGCRYEGTGTTVAQFQLANNSGTLMTHTVPTCVKTPTNATYQSVTANNQLAAGEGLRLSVINVPNPTTDDYELCVRYTVDPQ